MKTISTWIASFACTLISINSIASSDESTAASSLNLNCSSISTLTESFEKIEAANEIWVKEKSRAAVQGNWDQISEGRRVELFNAELLPPGQFTSLYRQCWTYFADFEDSLIPANSPKSKKMKSRALRSGSSKKSPRKSSDLFVHQNELFEKWNNCVEVGLDPIPPEAREVKACWDKLAHRP